MEDSPIWPNPTPQVNKGIRIDDVSRLNTRNVGGIFQCRDEIDVINIISLAKSLNRSVTVRGTSHSMGGQSIGEESLIVDTARMKKMAYDQESQVVIVGAGALWCDVILYLNQYGMSPRTMQSYSSFSVGGSLAVNVHGVTTDECLAESIVSFKMVTADGAFVECSPDCEDEELRELYSLVIGGIGLFGIVTEVCLRVNENHNLEMIPLLLSTKEFIYHYDQILQSEDIEVKLARLDLSNLSQVDLFLFRKTANSKTVSDLPLVPRKMSATSRIFYKWLAPTIKELRFTIEHNLGIALDWNSDHNKQRNLLMFESAEPLARLFEPIFRTDDTFILQEYFIPKKNFLQWIDMATPIVNELNEIAVSESICSLLNITIRYVKKDKLTFLKYSREDQGVFAFVLYFRIHRSEDGDNYVKAIHEKLVEGTLKLQGTFYLPYRHHYTKSDLQNAYPNIEEFWGKKLQYDPECRFKNMWWDRYGPQTYADILPLPVMDLCTSLDENYTLEIVSERRDNSFRKILDSPRNSALFREGFLENIFNIEDSHSLYRTVAKVCWDIRNKTDDDIYVSLQEELNNNGSGPISGLTRIWKQINQLREQKEEILRETLGIVGRLGKLGHLHDYVSIGDHGKMVSLFKEKLLIDGTIQLVHDEHSQSIEAILERGDTEDVGQFNMIDYENPNLNFLPSSSSDLITMNQGLHHLPQNSLLEFLEEIFRVLRPGGLFIIREHDWDEEIHPDLLPMLDIAHMVFNAGTGVSQKNERLERRAFRSIKDWIKIISSVGFVNSMLYDMQDNDPTWDEMMCFYKPPLWIEQDLLFEQSDMEEKPSKQEVDEDSLSVLFLNAAKTFIHSLNNGMGDLHDYIKSLTSNLSSGQQYLVNNSMESFFEPLQLLLVRFIPLLDNVQISNSPSESFIPPEINLLIRALIMRVDNGTASPMEMMAVAFIKDFESAMSLGSVDAEETSSPHPIYDEEKDVTAEEIVSVLEHLLEELPELKNIRIIEEMGFSFMATRAAMKFYSSMDLDHDLGPSAVWISKKMDRDSWDRLVLAFGKITENHVLPSIDRFIDQDDPWHEVCLAIFSSPHVEFSRNFAWKASAVGLGDILQIYKKAKRTTATKQGSTIYEEEILEVIGDLDKGKKRKVSMTEGAFRDLHDVYEIVDAKYGYKSITADYIDCTDALKKLYLRGSSLHLKGKDVTADFGNEGIMPWKAWDDFRSGLRGKKRKLIVRYRSSSSPDSSYLEEKFDTVISYLKEEGWIGNSDSGHLTWFKLVEWLQVEMINQFGQSMNHTPWYRFPFLEYIRDYFKILIKETLIVREKFGWGKAIFSTAFMVDLIPGFVMSFIMLQMQLLAIPLRMIGGDEYDTARLVEQLTIFNPVTGNTDFKSIHDDILEESYITRGLYSIKVPTFKKMTNVVKALSKSLPNAYIIDISGNTEVQVKIKVPENSDSLELLEHHTPDGCKFKLKFSQSMDLDKNLTRLVNYAFEVKTLNLLTTIKWLHSLHVSEVQIYDFFH